MRHLCLVKAGLLLVSLFAFFSCASVQDNMQTTINELKKLGEVNFDEQDNLVEFLTSDKDSAHSWMFDEFRQGRMVKISYNKEKGEYLCKSIDRNSVKVPKTEEIIDLLDENGAFQLDD